MGSEERLLSWVRTTGYYQRRVRDPEWWQALPPKRRLQELRRMHRRLGLSFWVVNVLILVLAFIVLVLLAVAVVEPTVGGIAFAVGLLIPVAAALVVLLWVQRRSIRTRRRTRAAIRELRARVERERDEQPG